MVPLGDERSRDCQTDTTTVDFLYLFQLTTERLITILFKYSFYSYCNKKQILTATNKQRIITIIRNNKRFFFREFAINHQHVSFFNSQF